MRNCYRLSIQGHLMRVKEDTWMKSSGCREGPIENAYVQGAESCATPLLSSSTFRTCECVRAWKCCMFICKVSFWAVLRLLCPCCISSSSSLPSFSSSSPLSPHASGDGWAHLLQTSFLWNQDTAVAFVLLHWSQRIETSVYEYCMYTHERTVKVHFPIPECNEKNLFQMVCKVALVCVFLPTPRSETHMPSSVVSIAFVLTAPQRAESKA